VKPQHLLPAGVGPRHPQGQQSGLGTGGNKSDHLRPGHHLPDKPCPSQLKAVAGAVVGAQGHLFRHRCLNLIGDMPQEQGAVAHPVVNKLLPIHIPLPGPLGLLNVKGEGIYVASVMGYPCGQHLCCLPVQRLTGPILLFKPLQDLAHLLDLPVSRTGFLEIRVRCGELERTETNLGTNLRSASALSPVRHERVQCLQW